MGSTHQKPPLTPESPIPSPPCKDQKSSGVPKVSSKDSTRPTSRDTITSPSSPLPSPEPESTSVEPTTPFLHHLTLPSMPMLPPEVPRSLLMFSSTTSFLERRRLMSSMSTKRHSMEEPLPVTGSSVRTG